MSQLSKSWTSTTPLPPTRRMAHHSSSSLVKNTVLAHLEIGLLSKFPVSNSVSNVPYYFRGPLLQGVRAVIAQSFERIHRSNLVGMGILPLEFKQGENADTLGLTGQEQFTIDLDPENLKTGQEITVRASNGKKFTVKSRIDTDVEIEYYKNGGILPYVLRKLAK